MATQDDEPHDSHRSPASPYSSPSMKHDPHQRPSVSTSAFSAPRRTSTTSITSNSTSTSINAALDSTIGPDGTSVNEFSQNSISSLLSHPIVRTGLVPQSALSIPAQHRAPSARDIPPVTLTPIPHVDSSAFKSYLSKAGALYDSYRKSKLAPEEPPATPSQRGDKDASKADYFDPRSQSSYLASPTTPVARQPPSPTNLRRTSSATSTSKRDRSAPTPLSTIPNVYFDDNFQLANPRTFDVVSERSDVIPPDPQTSKDDLKDPNATSKSQNKTRRKALHTNAILQEKLSWYMDTVEVHLISSIATASSSFFAALGSLRELQSEATESIAKIKSLRDALRQLDQEMALGGLEVLTMRRRRDNLRKLSDVVAQLCQVIEEAKKCETLVDDGDLDAASTSIDNLESMIAGGETTDPDGIKSLRVDLRQLKALEGLSDGLSQLRQRISKGHETRFIDALLTDLRTHVDSVPPRETIQRWTNASLRTRGDQSRGKPGPPAYLKTNDQLRPELLKSLAGLARAGQTARAATAYREAIMREIKSMVRKHLPSSTDDDAESVTSISTSLSTRGGRRYNQQEKSSILARNLRALDPDSAEQLLLQVYTSVAEALQRLRVQVKVVLDVTSSLDQPAVFPRRSSSLTPSSDLNQIRDEVTQVLDMSNLLGQAVDVIQTQVTKVLKVRSEQNARLPLQQFLRYFTLNRLFTDECEAVSSRGGEALKEVVNTQVKEFLQVFADLGRQQIIQTLENDRWEAKDFGPAEARVLERILESMNRTPQAWTEHARVLAEFPVSPHINGSASQNTPEDGGSSNSTGAPPAKSRPATIDGQAYLLVHSTISTLHSIDSFLNLSAAIPSLTLECSLKLLDYIKTFNSRCCQLILGAGATKSAGLKNITSKHLALASQSCSFLIALVPYMREFVRRQTGGNVGNAFAEFDKVKRLLQEHQNSINEKLVDIMGQRSIAHINAMKKINWDAPEQEPTISPYMESLTKETGTLHRVLSRHVAEMDVRMIMTPIFANYSQEWSKAFREASVRTEAGKARMLRDVKHLDSRFAKIEGSGDLGSNLVKLVNDKQVQSQPAEASQRKSVEQKHASKGSKDLASKADTNSVTNEPAPAQELPSKAEEPKADGTTVTDDIPVVADESATVEPTPQADVSQQDPVATDTADAADPVVAEGPAALEPVVLETEEPMAAEASNPETTAADAPAAEVEEASVAPASGESEATAAAEKEERDT